MDLFIIARKVWRYKLFTLPVIVLTIFAAAYVMAVKQPLYEATSSYLLITLRRRRRRRRSSATRPSPESAPTTRSRASPIKGWSSTYWRAR